MVGESPPMDWASDDDAGDDTDVHSTVSRQYYLPAAA